MNQPTPLPARPATAQEVVDRFDLTDAARLLLREEQTPQQYFMLLTQAKHFPDAVRFAAEYLTPHEAVWWGALCLWQVLRKTPEATHASETLLLQVVVDWVKEPTEANRRECELVMHAADSTTIASNLALAAFFSGGSISLADQPEVTPPAGQSAHCVAAAVTMAARLIPPPLHEACLLHFLKLASEVSCGEAPWQIELADIQSPEPLEAPHAR